MARSRDGMLGQGGQRRKMSPKAFKGDPQLADRAEAEEGKAAMFARIKEMREKRVKKDDAE